MRAGARIAAAAEVLDEILDPTPPGLLGARRLGQGASLRRLG